jgi:hypothetical protein
MNDWFFAIGEVADLIDGYRFLIGEIPVGNHRRFFLSTGAAAATAGA